MHSPQAIWFEIRLTVYSFDHADTSREHKLENWCMQQAGVNVGQGRDAMRECR